MRAAERMGTGHFITVAARSSIHSPMESVGSFSISHCVAARL
jgi:hypothetical protein